MSPLTSAAATLVLLSGGGPAPPAGGEPGETPAIERVQYYRDGQRQCWYPNDLEGPGWRPCGYNWHRDAGPRWTPPGPAQRGQPPGTNKTWSGRQWGPGYGKVRPSAPSHGPRPPTPPRLQQPGWRMPPEPGVAAPQAPASGRVDSRVDSRVR